jgi:hypothetical protein
VEVRAKGPAVGGGVPGDDRRDRLRELKGVSGTPRECEFDEGVGLRSRGGTYLSGN